MDLLTKEEVLHVAHLARIDVTDEEIETYRYQLKELINEVEKINNVEISDEDMLITPVKHTVRFRDDENKNKLFFDDVKKNATRVDGNFVEVPVMINE